MGNQDVLNTSYRKAGKLDSSHFAVNLDLEALGLLPIIRSHLLEGVEASRPIHAELDKLNVYGMIIITVRSCLTD